MCLLAALCLVHVFVFAAGLASIAVLAVLAAFLGLTPGGADSAVGYWRAVARNIGLRAILLTAAASPSFVLLWLFFRSTTLMASPAWPSLMALARGIVACGPLWAFGGVDIAFGLIFNLLMAVLFWHGLQRRVQKFQMRRSDALLGLVLIWLAVYCICPDQWKTFTFISKRLAIFFFSCLLLGIAGLMIPQRIRRFVVVASVFLSLAMLTRWTLKYRALNSVLKEYTSVARQIAPNSRLLAVSFADYGAGPDGEELSWEVAPFMHASGYLGVDRTLVVLDDYEARVPYFPLSFRNTSAPRTLLRSGISGQAPRIDIAGYEKQTCSPVDYVLLWQLPGASGLSGNTRTLLDGLGAHYVLTSLSQPRGLVRLYRRQNWTGCPM
jgi:hypothetical protein